MKNFKLFAIAFLCILTVKSFSQTETGKIIVSGESSLGFSSMSQKYKDDNGETDGNKTLSIEFAPQAGYFVMDGLAVGIALPISFDSEKNPNNDKNKVTSLAIAPFARYYFSTTNIKPYLQAAVGFGSAKYTDEPDGAEATDTKLSVFLYDLGAGVGIFLNDKVSIDVGASYSSYIMKPKEDNPSNVKMITSGFGLNLGFSIFF